MSTSTPTGVTVVIPVLNGALTLGRQLDAIAANTTDLRWQIVVVDNGSTDDTPVVALEHELAATGRLRLVNAASRRGVNVARNSGVRESEDQFILICDSDDEVTETWIADHYAALSREVLAVSAGPLSTESLNTARSRTFADGLNAPKQFGAYCSGFGANFGFTRSAWTAVGGFDEALAGGFDEIDFFVRVQQAGGAFAWVPTAVVNYRLPATLRHAAFRSYRFGRMSVSFGLLHPSLVHQAGVPTLRRRVRSDLALIIRDLLSVRSANRRICNLAYDLGALRQTRSEGRRRFESLRGRACE